MSRDGSITLMWGDGERRFRLPIGQMRELEEKCLAGPQEILDRLATKRWKVDDIRETLRLGLIGAGITPVEATMLVSRYVDPPERPWLENVPAAQAVLLAALIGTPEEPLGKETPAGENATMTGEPNTPPSTEPEPPSASTLDRSTNGHFGNISPSSRVGKPPTESRTN